MNKKILLAFCLVSGLLPGARVLAFDDTSRMDILGAKVAAVEYKSKLSDEKIKTLESKISQLESRISPNDSKRVAYLARMNMQLESRVSDLEAAQSEKEKSGKALKRQNEPARGAETYLSERNAPLVIQ